MDRRILTFLILAIIVFSVAPLIPKAYGEPDSITKFLGGSNRNPCDVYLDDLPWNTYKSTKFVKGESRPKTGYAETPFSSDEGITVTIKPGLELNGKKVWKFFWVIWSAVPTNNLTFRV